MPIKIGYPPLEINDALLKVLERRFDFHFYRSEYPDLLQNDKLIDHYINVGWTEGRNPCSWFDGFSYLLNNPDVEERAINPFLHFLGWGLAEGRKFDSIIQPSKAAELALGSPIVGWKELIKNEIDLNFYGDQLEELLLPANIDLVAHYCYAGWRMGLRPNPEYHPTEEATLAAEKFSINPLVYDILHRSQTPIRSKSKDAVDKPNGSTVLQPAAQLSTLGDWDLLSLLYASLQSNYVGEGEQVDLALTPANQVVQESAGMYKSIGDDPQFILNTAEQIGDAWYLFETDLSSRYVLEPHLYIATAADWSTFSQITLGRTRSSGILSKPIFMPRGTTHIRLDPADFEVSFSITYCKLRRLTGAEIWKELRSVKNRSSSSEGLASVKESLNFLPDAWMKRAADVGNTYEDWLQRYSIPDSSSLDTITSVVKNMINPPLISIIMATYNTPIPFLRAAVDSIQQQIYENWELCIADDASTDPEVSRCLAEYAARDGRIKVVSRKENGNISAASNSALALASGEYIALVDHDDVIYPHTLAAVAAVLIRRPQVQYLYTDEDKIDESGVRFDPHFKSAWNPELALNQNYLNHLSVFKKSLISGASGFRIGFEGSQDYDLILRTVMNLKNEQIFHLPLVLYSWRVFTSSASFSQTKGRRAKLAGMLALSDYINYKKINAEVVEPSVDTFRIKRLIGEERPLVSVIIPTRNRHELLRHSVDAVLFHNNYKEFEVIIVDNGSDDPNTLSYFAALEKHERIRVVKYPGEFNYSAINNFAAQQAKGEYILLLNNDIKAIGADWLEELLSVCMGEDVGIVGSKLLYANDTVQHGGVILGLGGVAGHSHKHRSASDPGYFRRLQLAQDLNAVTAACLLIKKHLFDEVGGLDGTNLKVAFNDVDLCMKVRAAGKRVIFNPHSTLYHLESVSRGNDSDPDKIERFHSEIMFMKQKWGDKLLWDRFYNPNLTIAREDFSIAWPPRIHLLSPFDDEARSMAT